MSGTYLVCDQCGKFGPPAGFLVKDGIRLCYECYFESETAETPAGEQESPAEPDRRQDTDPPA